MQTNKGGVPAIVLGDEVFSVVVVPSLDGYPAIAIGRTVIVEDTGDAPMTLLVARSAAMRAIDKIE